jgi:hypothetical protein
VGGSLVAAFVILFSGYRLLNLLALSHAQSLLGAGFLFFALNGLVWLVLPLDALRAGVDLGSILAAGPLPQIPNAITPLRLPPARTFFLEPFLSAGPLLVGLSYFLLFGISTMATLGEDRPRWGFFTFLCTAGLLLFHTGLGLLVLTATLLAIPVILAGGGLNPFRAPGRDVLGILLPVSLAVVVSLPYLVTVEGTTPREFLQFLDVAPLRGLRILLLLLPSLLMAPPVLWAFLAGEEVHRQAWAVWTVLCALVSLLMNWPAAESRVDSVILAHVPLALSAGVAVPFWWRRCRGWPRVPALLFLGLVLVVPTLQGVAGYLRLEDPRDSSPALAAAAEWMREQTEPDAVVVDGSPDLALAAGRRQLLARPHLAGRMGYPDLDDRRLGFVLLLRGGEIPNLIRRHLLALDAPLYVVHRLPEARSREISAEFETVYENETVWILRWAPSARPRKES